MGNSVIGARMEGRRKEKGLTLDDIAQEIGVAKSTIHRYEKGTIETLKLPVIEAIARVLAVNPAWLVGKSDDMLEGVSDYSTISSSSGIDVYRPRSSMPILGRIAAGLPMYADENIEGYLANDFTDENEYFALVVHGDSMNAAGITDGDYIIVRKQSEVERGEIAVVLVNGYDATVKRFAQDGDTVILTPQSYNPQHQPQIYNLKEIPISVVGKVVEIRKKL